MYGFFFLILFLNIFTNAEINNFFEIVTKDLDNKDVSFEKYNGKCVLVVFQPPFEYENRKFIDHLIEKEPELEIVVFPSNVGTYKNEDLKKWFFETCKVKFDVMSPINLAESEIYDFLNKNSDDIYEETNKFLVEKNGIETTRFNLVDGPREEYIFRNSLDKCLGKKIQNFHDLEALNIYDRPKNFKEFENKCVFVIYVDIKNHYYSSIRNFKYLIDLKKNNPSIELVVVPKAYNQEKRRSFRKLYIEWAQSELTSDKKLINLLAPIYFKIEDTTIYKFLIERAHNKEELGSSTLFFVGKDGLSVTILEDLPISNLDEVISSNNCQVL